MLILYDERLAIIFRYMISFTNTSLCNKQINIVERSRSTKQYRTYKQQNKLLDKTNNELSDKL